MTAIDHDSIDLDAYFERIGYDGPREPTLRLLADLCRLHPRAIAFENLDPLLGRPIGLDAASLEAKLVRAKRGGYCFEHNRLLHHVLVSLGLEVRALGARVLLNQPEGAVTPRTHILLHVTIAGRSHIADVGFGGLTPTGPLRLETGCEQVTPHETCRFVAHGPEFTLEARVAGAWTRLYRFDLVEHFAVDHDVNNFYIEHSPKSFFRNAIVAARPVAEGRHLLFNDRLTFQRLNGARDTRTLRDADHLNGVLTDIFGIDVPDPAGLGAVFGRFVAAQRNPG